MCVWWKKKGSAMIRNGELLLTLAVVNSSIMQQMQHEFEPSIHSFTGEIALFYAVILLHVITFWLAFGSLLLSVVSYYFAVLSRADHVIVTTPFVFMLCSVLTNMVTDTMFNWLTRPTGDEKDLSYTQLSNGLILYECTRYATLLVVGAAAAWLWMSYASLLPSRQQGSAGRPNQRAVTAAKIQARRTLRDQANT